MYEVYRFRTRWTVSPIDNPTEVRWFERVEELPLDQLDYFQSGPRALLALVRSHADRAVALAIADSGFLYETAIWVRPRQVCRATIDGGPVTGWKDDGDWLDKEVDGSREGELGWAAFYSGAMVQHEAEKRRDREQYGIPADDPAYPDLGTVAADAFEEGKRILREDALRRRKGVDN